MIKQSTYHIHFKEMHDVLVGLANNTFLNMKTSDETIKKSKYALYFSRRHKELVE